MEHTENMTIPTDQTEVTTEDMAEDMTVQDNETEATSEVVDTEVADAEMEDADTPVAEKPDFIPEKFWDKEAGEVRLEALAKSYTELERRLSRSVSLPRDETDTKAIDRMRRVLGVPATPAEYDIKVENSAVEPDAELHEQMHREGFTNRQVEFVYELANDRLTPMIENAVATIREERDMERLAAHFGGPDAYADVSEQIMQWAEANLTEDIIDSLGSSVEGVITLHRLMKSEEPSLLSRQSAGSGDEEGRLKQMMQDPRYWRDRDPAFIAEVTQGFRKVYGG